MKLSRTNPLLLDLPLSAEEFEARKITAESLAEWGEGVDLIDQTAEQIAELAVGIAHTAFIAGKAQGMMSLPGEDEAHAAYLEGIDEGKRIERESRGE